MTRSVSSSKSSRFSSRTTICTVTSFFLAFVIALAIASTTSQLFQVQSATCPLPSQTTITALKRNCLPQEVTLVTLSIAKSSSLKLLFFFQNFHLPLPLGENAIL